jgi:hypothetical protein
MMFAGKDATEEFMMLHKVRPPCVWRLHRNHPLTCKHGLLFLVTAGDSRQVRQRPAGRHRRPRLQALNNNLHRPRPLGIVHATFLFSSKSFDKLSFFAVLTPRVGTTTALLAFACDCCAPAPRDLALGGPSQLRLALVHAEGHKDGLRRKQIVSTPLSTSPD